MSKAPEERREGARIDKIQLVQVSRFDEDGSRADLATGRTLNLSQGGIRLELHYALPLRSRVKLSVALENQIIDVSGTVVYLEVIDDVRCCMGVAFDDLSPEAAAILGRHVEPPKSEEPYTKSDGRS